MKILQDQIFWSILTVVSTMIDSASHLLQDVNDGTAMINVSNDVDEEQVKIMRLFCKVLISSGSPELGSDSW